MVHDIMMLRPEYNRANPILIDRGILCDHNTKVTVHPCNWDGCMMHIAVEHKQVCKHLQQHHGLNTTSPTSDDMQQTTCLWTACLGAHMKLENLPRHMLLSHLGVRWICSTCGGSLSREDAFRRHALERPGCQYAKPVVKYGDGSLVIDNSVVLDGGWSASQKVRVTVM